MVNYPAQIDNSLSIPASVDNSTPVTASVTNRLRDAIIAIESELGVKPGGVSTVKARFASLESTLENLDPVLLGGDIGGTTSLPLVIGLQGQPLSDDEPTLDDVLIWNGLAWVPGPIASTGSFTAGGDLSGTSTSQTVDKINGTTITTAGGALSTGSVLRTTAAGTADWGAVDLADIDAITGVLPKANQEDQDMVGDVSGSTGAASVDKVKGTTITTAGGFLAVGAVLRTTAAGIADWGQVDLADTDAITGILPKANQEAQDLAGDVSGNTGASVVDKVKGTTITTAGGALAVGAVLRTTAVGTADWGQVDLADTDAVTGVLATGNVATTLSSKTLASPTITGTVTYQGTRLRILSIPGELQTTDDTVTTVVSFTMVDETLCAFDVIVTAALQTAVTDGGRWKRSVVYRRTAAGVPTIVGTLESGTDQEVTAGLDVTIDQDGTDTVRVRVTGIAATNFNWTAELRVQETLATA